MIELSVNVDHVATVREARKGLEPDPVAAAIEAEVAGASGITVHLREDRRHIQDRDLRVLREMVKTKLNMEMAATEEMISIAIAIRPDLVTLVPEKRAELTTEGGLNIVGQEEALQKAISTLQEAGIVVSLFIDPDLSQVQASARVRANCVEIHTGRYAEAFRSLQEELEMDRIINAASLAAKLGMRVHGGHGLNYQNIGKLVDKGKEIQEVSIGHSIVARSLFVGMAEAVREMLRLLSR
ncbi:MAG: pyridoxine 5'-phosphate synthase [Candidatus Eiseniibacteriota bacterium]|nr:MAG: pyridoxine 5'-phosphate synthase [Candidatus Eisenbacteria bacterium]